ncbi:FkbM family methyltransferase [Emcibacter sp. SYSU 3D8]|uniref:FkbM family methyltransferase n=1 Tax=Emcibacter sp. SYSU 3D8 TaxID=3133969 RepID=UPI0031FEA0A0
MDNGLIYDVGAHRGEDSDYYLRLGYRVVAVEANPHLVDWLRTRFRQEIADGSYILIPNAIGERGEQIDFYVNRENSAWGTTNPEWAGRNRLLGAESDVVTVDCVRFADILHEHGCPHYLKIDIEGADMRCVEDLAEAAVTPAYISIESSKTSWRALLGEFEALSSLGYTRFKVVDQCQFEKRQLSDSDGNVIDYTFGPGASGPFGEDLAGKWLTRRQAIIRYIPIFLVYKTLGDNTLLSRLLARLPVFNRLLHLVSWYDTHARKG